MRKTLSVAFACLILTLSSQIASAQAYTTTQTLAVPHRQLEGGSLNLPLGLGTIQFLGLKIGPTRIAYRMDLGSGTEEVLSSISTCEFGRAKPYRQERRCHSLLKHDGALVQFSFEFSTMRASPEYDDAVYVWIATSDRMPSMETTAFPKELRTTYNLGSSPLKWGPLPLPKRDDLHFIADSLLICDVQFDLGSITVCTEDGAYVVLPKGKTHSIYNGRTPLLLSWQGGGFGKGGEYIDITLTASIPHP